MRIKRLARAFALLLVGLGVLVASAVIVVRSDWLRDRLRRLAMTQAAKYLAGDLTIDRLSGTLLHDVTLDGVTITQADGVMFHADRITVRYDPWVLAHRHLIFDDIVVEHPTIRIAEGSSGWNIGHMLRPRPPATGKPLELAFQHVQLRNADVTMQALVPSIWLDRHFGSVNVDTRVTRANGRFVIDIATATFQDDRSGFAIERLSGTLENGAERMDVNFDASRGAARLGGRVQSQADATGRRLQMALDLARVDLTSILSDAKWASDLTLHTDVNVDLPPALAASTFAFQVAGSHAAAFGYEGTNLTATGTYTRGRLAFDAATDGYGGHATVGAAWQITPTDRSPRDFQGMGTFRDMSLPNLPASLHLPPLASDLAGRFALHQNDEEWSASVVLDASTVEDAALRPGTFGHFSRRDGTTAYLALGHITGFDLRRIAQPLDLSVLDSARFRSELTGEFYTVGLEGCRACPAPRMVVAGAAMEHASMAETTITGTTGSMTLVGPRLEVAANGAVAHLTAEILGAPPSLALDLNGAMDGTLVIPDVHAPFTASAIEASGVLALNASTVQGVDVTEGRIDAAMQDGVATIRDLTARGPAASVTAKGVLAFGEHGDSALTISAQSEDLRVLGDRVQWPITGAGSVSATIQGPADHPSATGKLTTHQVGYGTSVSALTFNTDFVADLPGWQVQDATVSVHSAATFAKLGSLDIVRMNADATFHHNEIDLDTTMADEQRELDLSGHVAFDAAERSLAFRKLAISTGGIVWTLPAETQARVSEDGATLTVRGLDLIHESQSLSIAGAFPLGADANTAASGLVVKATALQLADLNRVLLGTRRLEGLVNGTATIGGTFADPTAQADLEVTNGAIEGTKFESLRGSATVQSHDITVNATLVQSAANGLTVTGHVPFGDGAISSGRALDISVKSTPIDLGLGQLFTTELTKIAGTGALDLHVTGSPQQPLVDGTVQVSHGAFTVVGSGVGYRNLDGDLSFAANHLTINGLKMTDAGGHELRAEGGLDILGDPAKRTLDITVTANSVQVLDNDLGSLKMNAAVRVSGDLSGPTIDGRISLDSGRLEVDQILERTTKTTYSEAPAESLSRVEPAPTPGQAAAVTTPRAAGATGADAAAKPATFLDRVTLSLALDLPDNLVMRGRDLRVGSSSIGLGDMNIIAGGTLQIRKPAGAPLDVLGDLQIVRGNYSFQGRRFEVQRGSDVRFAGQDISNPALNVTAERDVSGIAALVHVRGSARRPDVSLSSQPPLDEAEILSLIVFGQPLSDLGQGQRTSLAAQAGIMAAGAITTPLADSVARALNLDVFEILAPTDTEKAPVVSVGSQIGTRVYVGIKQEIGRDESSAISFQYRIAHFLRLVTSFAQGALQTHALTGSEAGGVDLIFVFRY